MREGVDRLRSISGLQKPETALRRSVTPILPSDLWPGGAKVGWWQKTVQLDLEAKGMLKRDTASKPMRWYRA